MARVKILAQAFIWCFIAALPPTPGLWDFLAIPKGKVSPTLRAEQQCPLAGRPNTERSLQLQDQHLSQRFLMQKMMLDGFPGASWLSECLYSSHRWIKVALKDLCRHWVKCWEIAKISKQFLQARNQES